MIVGIFTYAAIALVAWFFIAPLTVDDPGDVSVSAGLMAILWPLTLILMGFALFGRMRDAG